MSDQSREAMIKAAMDIAKDKGLVTKEEDKPSDSDIPNTEQQSSSQQTQTETPNSKQTDDAPVETPKEPTTTTPIDDPAVFKYLSEKLGKEVSSFDGMYESPKEIEKIVEQQVDYASEQSKAFDDYVRDTNGRGLDDYMRLQRDVTTESQDKLARELLRRENPDFSSEDIDFMFEDKYGFDKDVDDEVTIRRREIALKSDANKVRNQIIADQEQYKLPKTTSENSTEGFEAKQVELQKQMEQSTKLWKQAVSDNTKDFEGINLHIADDVDFTFKAKQEEVMETRNLVSDPNTILTKLYGNDKGLIDTKTLHEDIYFLKNKDKIMQEGWKQAFEAGREAEIKQKVNPNIGGQPSNSSANKETLTDAQKMRKHMMDRMGGGY